MRRYLGTYRLVPSAAGARMTLNADGTLQYSSEDFARLGGSFLINDKILRIFLSFPNEGRMRTGPIGTFLIADYQEKDWRGIWDGETRYLKRAVPTRRSAKYYKSNAKK